MPRLIEDDPEIERIVAEIDAWKAEFKRSRKGNLWQRWQDITLTVFRKDGRFAWCICASSDDITYSEELFETETGALSDLAYRLDIGRV